MTRVNIAPPDPNHHRGGELNVWVGDQRDGLVNRKEREVSYRYFFLYSSKATIWWDLCGGFRQSGGVGVAFTFGHICRLKLELFLSCLLELFFQFIHIFRLKSELFQLFQSFFDKIQYENCSFGVEQDGFHETRCSKE